MAYAASVYSSKSETSAKSGRSFLSLGAIAVASTAAPSAFKQTLWKSLKSWMRPPTTTQQGLKQERQQDNDSIATTLTGTTSSSSTLKPQLSSENNNNATAEYSGATYLRSSSSSLLETTPKGILVKAKRRQCVERVTFRDPSPVPRFRNVPPPPPPSPPYLEIVMHHHHHNDSQSATIVDDNVFMSSKQQPSLSPTPKITKSRRLCFTSPWHRGQTLFFTLHNALPEDHIIVFKFLTSNAKLSPNSSASSTRSSFIGGSSGSSLASQERYFVRPSAGKTSDQTQVMLFLNQVPDLDDAASEKTSSTKRMVLKDKILVRWAAIQRHTQVASWVESLPDSTRRRWLEMLVERWPDQVVVRETRLKIRFL
ncbi:hypothetical protein O0I10_007717 [Lichtheimia ornata]|uniref:MSP domain-containing protein n=1 Tax=Lichtheimia ornata TaxID=688661 RepID=A0AAD7V1Q3_9FUNG|nr:uncharacterized protein O0I10_007717 [Lichtheimia ornata]KAJ8656640.1 hypothetical protein O0I10_007717 [Lichtheimia ornata]